MKPPSLSLCLVAAVSFGAGLPGFAAVPKAPKDKVEFTSPTETTTGRPSLNNDPTERQSGFSRRESSSVASDLPLPVMPSAEELERRKRIVLELIERRSEMNRLEMGGGSAMSLDDPMVGESTESLLMGLDDRSPSRSKGRLDRSDRDSEGASRGDRTSDEGRESDLDRTRATSRERDAERGQTSREGNNNASDKDRNARENAFLPVLDVGTSRLLEREDRRAAGEGFLETGRLVGGAGSGRLSDDTARSRSERMESFRKLLAPLPGSGAAGVGGGAGGGLDLKAGGLNVPGTAGSGVTGGRSMTDALNGRAAGPAGDVAVDRSFAMPTRPVELDLGLGRNPARNSTEQLAPQQPVRAMDLFQRKHDTRIPTRDF